MDFCCLLSNWLRDTYQNSQTARLPPLNLTQDPAQIVRQRVVKMMISVTGRTTTRQPGAQVPKTSVNLDGDVREKFM